MEVAAIDDGLMFILCGGKLGHGNAGGQRDGELFFKGLAIFFEIKAEGTAQDNVVGADVGDDGSKTSGHAAGDLNPVGFLFDLRGGLAIVVGDGFSGGEVFPFE